MSFDVFFYLFLIACLSVNACFCSNYFRSLGCLNTDIVNLFSKYLRKSLQCFNILFVLLNHSKKLHNNTQSKTLWKKH